MSMFTETEVRAWMERHGLDDGHAPEMETAMEDAATLHRSESRAVPVVCLCGSTRFRAAWVDWYGRLTDDGEIVLSAGRFVPVQGWDVEKKVLLDQLHLRKIDLCDRVFVLDVGGYIGQSTANEIAYAAKLGKPIAYLSKACPDYVMPATAEAERDAARAELAALREQTRIRVTATEPPRVEHYKVLALKASWDVWTMQEGGVVVARPEKYPRWLPLPATPEQEPPTGEWIPLSPESAPPEGVRVRVLTIKGCEYYATRSGQAMLIGVPDSWGTVCTHWKCDPDSAPEAEPGKDDREGGA